MRRGSFVVLGALALTALFVGPSSAQARGGALTTFCNGTLASGSYGKLVVPAGASCNGTSANIRVSDGVNVKQGATFVLGKEGGSNTGIIRGGVHANAPASLQLHFARVYDGVRMYGGGGNGQFSTIEDNVIRGGVTQTGYRAFWLGFIRNRVIGNVRLSDNVMKDPDANEYVTNRIQGNLVCRGNSPTPQVGDSGGQPNIVTGSKVGQCRGS
jgi:hypothetical protein